MTVRIYSSTDASAPTLTGVVSGAYSSGWAAGTLLNLLDKILVAGYGSKTAAGWTLSFTGTSKGVFRQGSGCQFYLRVLDDGSPTAGAREAVVRGYEAMSDVDTGTGSNSTGFPASATATNYLRKSDTLDATPRSWVCYADNKTFYLYIDTGFSTRYYTGLEFGNFYSLVPGDAYNCMIVGRSVSAATDNPATNDNIDKLATGVSAMSVIPGHWIARGYSQVGVPINFTHGGAPFCIVSSTTAGWGDGNMKLPFPNPADNKVYIMRKYIVDITTTPLNGIRGYYRGHWGSIISNTLMPASYQWSGTGTLAGKTFAALGMGGPSPQFSPGAGRIILETSDTWE